MQQKLQIIITTTTRLTSLVKKTLRYPKDTLATMLRNKAPTIETDAYLLENYSSFTTDMNTDEKDKNIKQEESFDRIIMTLLTLIMTKKIKVRVNTSNKNITQKSLQSREKLKRKAQSVNCTLGKRKPKKPKKSSKKSS